MNHSSIVNNVQTQFPVALEKTDFMNFKTGGNRILQYEEGLVYNWILASGKIKKFPDNEVLIVSLMAILAILHSLLHKDKIVITLSGKRLLGTFLLLL